MGTLSVLLIANPGQQCYTTAIPISGAAVRTTAPCSYKLERSMKGGSMDLICAQFVLYCYMNTAGDSLQDIIILRQIRLRMSDRVRRISESHCYLYTRFVPLYCAIIQDRRGAICLSWQLSSNILQVHLHDQKKRCKSDKKRWLVV